MEIYGNHYIPMKPVSTLLQNSVRNGDIITAQILNTKNRTINKSLPVTKTTKKQVSLKKR
jgi:phosphoribosylcarboxyaminoimidazole (NCAIR) mutase